MQLKFNNKVETVRTLTKPVFTHPKKLKAVIKTDASGKETEAKSDEINIFSVARNGKRQMN